MMSKKDNPIIVVSTTNKDHRPPPGPRGGAPKLFSPLSQSERLELASQAQDIMNELSASCEHTKAPAVVKVTLKEKALAKSHRPINLFNEKTCPIIGTLDFGEILISATQSGLRSLKQKILKNTSQKTVANLTTIEKIELYSELERLNGYSEEKITSLILDGNTLKIRLFNHNDQTKNEILLEELFDFATKNKISIKRVVYGKDNEFFTTKINDLETSRKIKKMIGVRSLSIMPRYSLDNYRIQPQTLGHLDQKLFPPPAPDVDYPVVGIIDSGICPNNTLLQPWIVGRESFVATGDECFNHGTMVAGLIVNSKGLNHLDSRFPNSKAKIVDVNVFPKGSDISEDELVHAIQETIPKYPEVKVWNLSLGSSDPVGTSDFSDFACFLDEMHDQHGCLFVVSAGNQNDNSTWPTLSHDSKNYNRISSPGDSIRAVTVGSIAHKDTQQTLVKSEQSSPFSRIGPGPCFIPKPELIHYGGNTCEDGGFAQTGILTTGCNNTIVESIGTSFSTPIVSSIAAQIYHFLSKNNQKKISTEQVKALLIHSALLNNQSKITHETINNYGFGKPTDIESCMYCEDNCVTLLLEVDVKHGGFEFEKFPFPIAECLHNSDGKFNGEIIITLVYSPLVNKNFSSEYCRTNIDVGMGSYSLTADGLTRSFSGKIPAAPDDMSQLYEKSQIENGFKWSPVKVYYKRFPRGVDIKPDEWRLKMKVERRAEEIVPEHPQKATLVLSIRSKDSSHPVYNQTVKKINSLGWITHNIDEHIHLKN